MKRINKGYNKEKKYNIEERRFSGLRKKGENMLKEKVEKALQEIRPHLQADGGDVELVDVTDEGIVKVKLTGACGCCPMSTYTLKLGIEQKLKQAIPEIKKVESVA
jgi:Fe-S cluster biogenesis protein NfuA